MAVKRLTNRPGVQVQQELLSNSAVISIPDQPSVVIGPNVQIVDDAYVSDFEGLQIANSYPDLETAAKVDLDSVAVRLKDVMVDVHMGADAVLDEDRLISASARFGSQNPTVSLASNVVAASGMIDAAGPQVDPTERPLSVSKVGEAFVFTYAGVASEPFDVWPADEEVSFEVEGLGTMVFAIAAQEPLLLPASDDVKVLSWSFVKVGDTVRLGMGDDVRYAQIKAIVSDTTLRLNLELPVAFNGPFTILRKRSATFKVPAAAIEASEKSFTIKAPGTEAGNPPLMVMDAFDATRTLQLMIVEGKIHVDYEALRTKDANVLIKIEQDDDIRTKLTVTKEGDTAYVKALKRSERNPLALAANVMKVNNAVRSVFVMPVESDDSAGFKKAIDALQAERVYAIVCMTQSEEVNEYLKNHVRAMSEKVKSRFRIALVNYEHPYEEGLVAGSGATYTAAAGVVTLVDLAATFASDGLRVGDVLVLKANDSTPVDAIEAETFHKVLEVVNDNRIRLENVRYESRAAGSYAPKEIQAVPDQAAASVDYEIIRVLDKDGQANAIADRAYGIAQRRVTYVTNHQVVLTVEDPSKVNASGKVINREETVPGYYLAAAIVGMLSGLPPHQGLTNLGISGIKSVRFANRYFTDDQLLLIAGNGGFIVVQESDSALPAAYLQTTTDVSTRQRSELSFTRVLDFYSTALKDKLSDYIGPYNIYSATFTALSNAVNGIHQELLGDSFDKIGAPILAANLDKLVQSETDPTGVDIVSTIVIPMPLNNISVTVQA